MIGLCNMNHQADVNLIGPTYFETLICEVNWSLSIIF